MFLSLPLPVKNSRTVCVRLVCTNPSRPITKVSVCVCVCVWMCVCVCGWVGVGVGVGGWMWCVWCVGGCTRELAL